MKAILFWLLNFSICSFAQTNVNQSFLEDTTIFPKKISLKWLQLHSNEWKGDSLGQNGFRRKVFNENRFNKILIGLTAEQVKNLVGPCKSFMNSYSGLRKENEFNLRYPIDEVYFSGQEIGETMIVHFSETTKKVVAVSLAIMN